MLEGLINPIIINAKIMFIGHQSIGKISIITCFISDKFRQHIRQIS
jgi:hypothetical protein